MALTDDEKATLDALTAKANEPDDADEFDIEIWDEKGAGAKIPYRKGRKWLERFGIDVEPPPDAGDQAGDGKTDGKPKTGTTQKYFGKSKP